MIDKKLMEELKIEDAPKKLIVELRTPEYAEGGSRDYFGREIYGKGLKRNYGKVSNINWDKKVEEKTKVKDVGQTNKWSGHKSQQAYFKKVGYKKYLRVDDEVKHNMYGLGIIVATNEKTIHAEKIGKYTVSFKLFGEKLVSPSELILVRPKEIKNI
jgi:hypothetical protein